MSIVTLPEAIERQSNLATVQREAEKGDDRLYAELDEQRYDLLLDIVETIAHCGDVGSQELAQAALGQLPPDDTGKVFDDVEFTEFQIDPQTEHHPKGCQPLYTLDDGTLFEDAEGRLFNKVGHGPAQGSVEVIDDNEISAYLDVGCYVRLHERKS